MTVLGLHYNVQNIRTFCTLYQGDWGKAEHTQHWSMRQIKT